MSEVLEACYGCTALAVSLRPGETRACGVCGDVLIAEPRPVLSFVGATVRQLDPLPAPARARTFAARPVTDPSPRNALARLLSDAQLVAVWETRSSVRAVDLDPESRRTRDDVEDDDDGRVRRRERALHDGMLLSQRLARIERVNAPVGAVIRFVVERVGPARLTNTAAAHVGTVGANLLEIVGQAFVASALLASWKRSGVVRMMSSQHGRELLDEAARVWVARPHSVDSQDIP